jgi:hypothetical protein
MIYVLKIIIIQIIVTVSLKKMNMNIKLIYTLKQKWKYINNNNLSNEKINIKDNIEMIYII